MRPASVRLPLTKTSSRSRETPIPTFPSLNKSKPSTRSCSERAQATGVGVLLGGLRNGSGYLVGEDTFHGVLIHRRSDVVIGCAANHSAVNQAGHRLGS